MWKGWNKLIWYTPIAFLSVLSAFGALLKYLISTNKIENILPVETNILLFYCSIFSGISLIICSRVLYGFARCREKTSAYIANKLECEEKSLFQIWSESGRKGYNSVAFLLNASGVFLLLKSTWIFLLQLKPCFKSSAIDLLPVIFFDSLVIDLLPVIFIAASIIFGCIITGCEMRSMNNSVREYDRKLKTTD